MSLESAPWALDGARTNAALARRASYAETSGAEGVISPGDLKVTPLDVPGVGVQVSAGGALLLNRYQTSPVETYTATNVSNAVLDSSMMPPASPAAQSHLVCVTIGDPEFSQVGHPWMTSDPIPTAEVEDYQYVRFVVLPNVPSTTTSFKQLNSSYPAIALARIDVPANTSTITSDMIVDLRHLARPRSKRTVITAVGSGSVPMPSAYGTPWPSSVPVEIPEWATHVRAMIRVSGALQYVNNPKVDAQARAVVGDVVGPMSYLDYDPPYDGLRHFFEVALTSPLPADHPGTTRQVSLQSSYGSGGTLYIDIATTLVYDIEFTEESV